MSVAQQAAKLLRWQEAGCRLAASPSPFYAEVFMRLAQDADAGGEVATLLARTPMTVDSAAPLRLLGGVNRGVLAGTLPELASYWPTTDSPGDPVAAHSALTDLFADPPDVVLDALSRDPQTNEVGRSAALAGGLAEIAAATKLPIRLFEIGTSAGLNLRMDHYAFRARGNAWGDSSSAVRFDEDAFAGSVAPPFGAGAVIAERRGCDLYPIDATTGDGATLLLSYVWPDQHARLARLRAALAVSARVPVAIDQASADDWVDQRLHPTPGAVTVLLHSIMWQYLPGVVQRRITAVLEERAAAASDAAPLAWLRLEPAPSIIEAELRLTLWPGGEDRVLGTSGFHGPPVTWQE